MPILAAVSGAASSGKGATPPVPTLSYTAENKFTITNYSSSLIYTVSGGTISENIVTPNSVGTTVTISSKYQKSVITSANKSLRTLAHSRVLSGSPTGIGSVGCGPRPTICCPSGMITDTSGNTCIGGPGTQGCFYECCPYGNYTCGNCTGLFGDCYNWYWTDYTANGYTLYGSVWGKVE